MPGNMNGDGTVDGDDIQPWVNCYIVGAPSFDCVNCACVDMNQDGQLSAADHECFVNVLLLLASCVDVDPCEAEGDQSSSSYTPESQQANATLPPGTPYDPEFVALVESALAWWAEHPRESYPEHSDLEYGELVFEQFAAMGLTVP